MEYTINQLAKLSGVSTRTLRHYDKIGLLKPLRLQSNGYRIYGDAQVDSLQQILFYRALDVRLDEIKEILNAPDFDLEKALNSHLSALEARKEQLEILISNVTRTLTSLKGETMMNNYEKFEGFKKEQILKNEAAYGQEIRSRYGDDTIDSCNARLSDMTEETWKTAESLEQQIKLTLAEAAATGDPSSVPARRLCELHRQWLMLYWPEDLYSKEAHLTLAESYTADPRFNAYYEEAALGGAKFLRDALTAYYTD